MLSILDCNRNITIKGNYVDALKLLQGIRKFDVIYIDIQEDKWECNKIKLCKKSLIEDGLIATIYGENEEGSSCIDTKYMDFVYSRFDKVGCELSVLLLINDSNIVRKELKKQLIGNKIGSYVIIEEDMNNTQIIEITTD